MTFLFPDAEVREDVLEYLVGGDFAEYVGEVVDAFAGVLAEEVGGGAVGEALTDAGDAVQCAVDGLEVSHIGQYDIVAVGLQSGGGFDENLFELK